METSVPLARYTTYRIGGPAAALLHAQTAADIAAAVRFASEAGVRWMALGLGSNVLVADRGFDGLVIRLGKGLDAVERNVAGDPTVWRVGAGLALPQLARQSADAGLSGLQRLVGVPGTIGGGVFMNAGAHGQDLASVVREIRVMDEVGQPSTIEANAIRWRYRSSGLGSVVVLGATLMFAHADAGELAEELRWYLERRRSGTPFNEPCCGSVFRNPPPDGLPADGPRTAGQLIEATGLKGFRIGGAEVSRKHANYIVNVGHATAADVLAVIDEVRTRVQREFGVEMRLEVKVVD